MAKENSWLNEQFHAARTEVQSWSTSKQTAMKNAVKSKGRQDEAKPPIEVCKNKSA